MQALDNQIELLKLANRDDKSYLLVIISDEEEDEIQEMISSYQKHLLWKKCALLSYALTLAKERMEKVEKKVRWAECCKAAIKAAKQMGLDATKHEETLMRLYREAAHKAIKKYAMENLSQLSCEMVSQFIHGQVIPKLIKEKQEQHREVDEPLTR